MKPRSSAIFALATVTLAGLWASPALAQGDVAATDEPATARSDTAFSCDPDGI